MYHYIRSLVVCSASTIHAASTSICHRAITPVLAMGLGLASWGVAIEAAWAEFPPDQQLLAQQIVEGLPPPPDTLPPAQLPAGPVYPAAPVVVPAPSSTLPVLPSSSPAIAPDGATQRYLVLINGDSPLLLEQVRKIESGAFLQNYSGRRVIQAGAFVEPVRAEQQVQALEAQGIGAEIVAVSAPTVSAPALVSAAPQAALPASDLVPAPTTPAREVVFGQLPSFDGSTGSSRFNAQAVAVTSPYFVVIPARRDDLPDISDQVIRLGEGLRIAQVVEERQSPLGPHVLVGPFVNRNAAERWNDYLRAFGMDARVYYRR